MNNVKHKNPSCWERCPQPGNSSSVCWVECLFNTLLGNSTAGLPAVRPLLPLPPPLNQHTNLLGQLTGFIGQKGSAELVDGFAQMTKAQIVEPFERSFATNDVSEGGCADWHPHGTA